MSVQTSAVNGRKVPRKTRTGVERRREHGGECCDRLGDRIPAFFTERAKSRVHQVEARRDPLHVRIVAVVRVALDGHERFRPMLPLEGCFVREHVHVNKPAQNVGLPDGIETHAVGRYEGDN